jgi:hypothetical protein
MGFDGPGLSHISPAPSARISRIVSTIRNYKFALAAFLLPFTVRAIPEIIAGPYPIGWDTIAFYVPNTLDMAAGKTNLWGIFGSGPLMYAFVVPIYLLTKISPIFLFKAAGPVLFGTLSWAVFQFCREKLRVNTKSSFLSVVFMSLYFVSLRVAWDAYQTELGLIFFIIGVTIGGESESSRRSSFSKGAFFILAALANQIVGVLVVGTIILDIIHARSWGTLRLNASRFAPVTAFGLVVYGTLVSSIRPGMYSIQGNLAPLNIGYNAVFLAYAFGPLLPLAVFGLSLVMRSQFSLWIGICAVGLAISTLPGQVFQDVGYRWVLLLSIPVMIMASQGYQKLTMRATGSNGKQWLKAVRLGVPLALIISAGMYTTIQVASIPYFSLFLGNVPSSLLQSSIPLSDSANVVHAFQWLDSSMPSDSAVITHEAFYGWARTYLTPDKTILNSLLNSPSSELGLAANYQHVFTVWWIQGSGWFSPTFPTGASVVATFGDIAVYEYR